MISSNSARKWWLIGGTVFICVLGMSVLIRFSKPVGLAQISGKVTPYWNSSNSSTIATNQKDQRMQVPGGPYEPQDPRWAEMHRREKQDPAWQGKVPIRFYGKVVDEMGKPIAGASIHFSWTDLSSAGASQRETRSDANGLFSLDGVRGKNLGVLVAKDGYDLSRTKNQFRFEYAGFWEKDFHESDVKRPVAFTLHKKPQAEPLVFREEEIAVAVGRRAMLNLDPQTTLEVELLANEQPRAKNWSARLSVKGGGLQLTTEEFPFEAPADGYRAELTIDLKTEKPGTWTNVYEGGVLYLKTAGGYGRLEVKTIAGENWMRVMLYLNPNGSKNLAYDPNKRVSVP